ncbi:hypothetical protein [Polyangium sp. 15x6]|uniref:hypothetical protein n=1 Tax=Polyangium sp. 15x6 TaxID=3042687 RepID=UPI00249BB1F7|nr:hypothetical protein [Polyangium sp. 15x6]MDI3282203.1 hypothetical protein [Polyangium sp. 15x6]
MTEVLERSELEGLELVLKTRVADLEKLMPGKSVPSETIVKAIFAHCAEINQLAKEAAARAGSHVAAAEAGEGEDEVAPDFSFPTFEAFLANEAAATEAAQEGATAEAGVPPKSLVTIVAAKLVSALGIEPGMVTAIIFAVEAADKKNWQALLGHLKGRRFAKAKKPLKKVLNAMRSSKFRKALAKRVGAKAAAKAVAKVASKAVPFVGWTSVIVGLVWAFGRQIR